MIIIVNCKWSSLIMQWRFKYFCPQLSFSFLFGMCLESRLRGIFVLLLGSNFFNDNFSLKISYTWFGPNFGPFWSSTVRLTMGQCTWRWDISFDNDDTFPQSSPTALSGVSVQETDESKIAKVWRKSRIKQSFPEPLPLLCFLYIILYGIFNNNPRCVV